MGPLRPQTTDGDTTVTIGGEVCVDVDAKHWVGSGVLTRIGSGRRIRFDGYGERDSQIRSCGALANRQPQTHLSRRLIVRSRNTSPRSQRQPKGLELVQ
jgi:hypothetical protein